MSYFNHSIDLATLKKDLVFYSKYDEKKEEPVIVFKQKDGLTALPRYYAGVKFSHYDAYQTHPAVFPQRPSPRNDKQRQFWSDLVSGVCTYQTLIASAQTGSGKTVGGLYTAKHLGVTTLIVVHMAKLAKQWKKEINEKLGVPLDEIGMVGDTEMDWKGKKICVAMLQTLRNGSMPPEFFEQFSFTILDELHKIAAPASSEVLFMLRSKYVLGLSATIDRKDGLHHVFHAHLGPVRVVSEQKSMHFKVHVVSYDNPQTKWAQEGDITYTGKQLNKIEADSLNLKKLEKDKVRNARIVSIIRQMYTKGRNAIIVGEHIDHLFHLRELVIKSGVPVEVIGMFTAQNAEQKKRRKTTEKELTFAKEKAQLCFATYGMLTEGIDEPRWDCGTDVTPRGSATQLVGRIRRDFEGKPTPMWITIRDKNCPLEVRFFSRMRDYEGQEAEITGV